MAEEGTAMEALLGGEGSADRGWQLNVNSFRLPEHQPSESPRTAAADCMKKFSTFHEPWKRILYQFGEDAFVLWTSRVLVACDQVESEQFWTWAVAWLYFVASVTSVVDIPDSVCLYSRRW